MTFTSAERATPVSLDDDESCGWRSLALAIVSLLAQTTVTRENGDEGHDELLVGRDGVLSTVAQQLKAPVEILQAHAQRLELYAENTPAGPDAAGEVAGRIVEQADIMADWVSAILDVQRLRLGKLAMNVSRVDLVALAYACADAFNHESRDREVRFVASGPATQHVLADPCRLCQAVAGVLQSTARSAPGRPLELRVGVLDWADGHPRAMLAVCDRDPALEPDELARLFSEPQTKLDVDMYVAREIARLHGGELWTERRGWEQGTTSVLVLPLDFSLGSHTVLAGDPACSAGCC